MQTLSFMDAFIVHWAINSVDFNLLNSYLEFAKVTYFQQNKQVNVIV